MGKFDDKGMLAPNRNRKSDRAPHLTGVLNFSKKTLDRLLQLADDDEDVKVQLSAWRSDDDPKRFSLKIDEPYDKSKGSGSSRGGSSGRRRDDDENRGGSRDDDDRGSRRPPARSKKYDDEEEERPAPRRRSRDDDDEAPW